MTSCRIIGPVLGRALSFGVALALLGPIEAPAQTGHPSGARGGILVPSALTLPRNAVALGSHATFTRDGTLNTALALGSITWAPSHFVQIYLSRSSFFSGSGDSYFDYDGFAPGHAMGPIGLTYRLPRPLERPWQFAFSGSVTPGMHQRSLSGHNHPYARDTFDVALSLAQSYTRDALQVRLQQGLVITEDAPASIPTHALLGAGATWWWRPWGGVEVDLLSRLETTAPLNVLEDYLGAAGGLVLRPGEWLSIRAGYLLGLSNDRTDGIGLRSERWMAYGGFEVVLWGRQPLPRPPDRPLRPPLAEPARPDTVAALPPLPPPPPPAPPDTVVVPVRVLPVETVTVRVIPEARAPLPAELRALEETFLRTGILAPAGLVFDFDRARVPEQMHRALQGVGQILRRYPELHIEIGGHTDNLGHPVYNLELSHERALLAFSWLLANIEGLDPQRFVVQGYGSTRPVASNDTEQGRRLNRRVEFRVLNPAELEKIRRVPPGGG